MTSEAFNVDCVKGMKTLDDCCVDLTVTSPPYDNLRNYHGYAFDYKETLKQLYRVTKKGGVVVWVVNDQTVDGSETGTSFRQALFAMECGFNLHDTMIYEKNGTGACGSNLAYWQSFEYMFVFAKGKPKTVNRLTNGKPRTSGGLVWGRTKKDGTVKKERRSDADGKLQIRSNIWTYNVGFTNKDDKTDHPAVFPIALATDHVLSWSNEGDLVLDPFLGSGTTRIAAYDLNRRFIGYEISKEYFDMEEERFERHTAQMNLFLDSDV